LNEVAIGDKPADLILENCSLVNVYSREIMPETQIAVSHDRIAYVGPDASHTKGKKTVIMNLKKKYESQFNNYYRPWFIVYVLDIP